MAAPLTERTITKLRELVATGALQPGGRLPPEEELAARLGASRNTTREAVRALVTARVLDVRRGDGTFVTSLEPELLLEGFGLAVEMMREEGMLELLEVRRILEPAATGLAATRLDAAALDALEGVLRTMRSVMHDSEQLVAHDVEFHQTVIAACGNRTLVSMLSGLSSRTIRARVWRSIAEQSAAEMTIVQHEEILQSLRARDPELARAAALTHVATTAQWFRGSPAHRSARRRAAVDGPARKDGRGTI